MTVGALQDCVCMFWVQKDMRCIEKCIPTLLRALITLNRHACTWERWGSFWVCVDSTDGKPKPNVGGGNGLVTSSSLLGDDVGEGLHLVLSATEGADATLDELASALVLGVTDELHGATLVRGEAGNLANDGADDLDALTLATLAVGGTGSENATLGLVTAVDAPDETWREWE